MKQYEMTMSIYVNNVCTFCEVYKISEEEKHYEQSVLKQLKYTYNKCMQSYICDDENNTYIIKFKRIK